MVSELQGCSGRQEFLDHINLLSVSGYVECSLEERERERGRRIKYTVYRTHIKTLKGIHVKDTHYPHSSFITHNTHQDIPDRGSSVRLELFVVSVRWQLVTVVGSGCLVESVSLPNVYH